MFTEDDLLPISSLQHLMFCERQWALIHLEGVWEENRLTAEGRVMHERVHEVESESRGDVRIARGLRVRSLRLGLTGQCDVVEFRKKSEVRSQESESNNANHEDTEAAKDSQIQLKTIDNGDTGSTGDGKSEFEISELRFMKCDHRDTGSTGENNPEFEISGVHVKSQHSIPYPIEYKRGKPKRDRCDEVQLCAQAVCLEEMLGVNVSEGALFYGKTRRRYDVAFDARLRAETERLAARLHELFDAGVTPRAQYEKKCDNCSLIGVCMPKTTGGPRSAARYLVRASAGTLDGEGEL
jgi:CRISPR-associated exonuclease Cas4